jgi:hypothetical protein
MRPVRIRALTMDVTGTLVSFRGSLSQHYLGSAEKCGIELPQAAPIGPAFRKAYKEVSRGTYSCVYRLVLVYRHPPYSITTAHDRFRWSHSNFGKN